MPIYDVECADCNYSSTIDSKILDLPQWDLEAICPSCHAGPASFRRVIKQAPARYGEAQTTRDQLASQKNHFIRSGARDQMRHQGAKKTSPEQFAAAQESVKRGEFEGF